MRISVPAYHRLAKLVGLVLTLMGVSLSAVFALFLWTGHNPVASTTLVLDRAGLLLMATIGAFALPLGLSLFSADSAASARLRIAAYALGFMALLRLGAFANADMRLALGIAPLVEFFVLGGIGLLAHWVRPENESPIDIHMEVDLEAPASEAWRVLGEAFGEVVKYARGVQSSSLDGELGVGAVRSCETPGFGPFASAHITERLIEFDPSSMKYTYVAGGDLPRMIPASKNRWSIQALGADRCRVRCHASIDLLWWALPVAPLLGWAIRSEVIRFGEDLRHRVEKGAVHPRKLTALAQA